MVTASYALRALTGGSTEFLADIQDTIIRTGQRHNGLIYQLVVATAVSGERSSLWAADGQKQWWATRSIGFLSNIVANAEQEMPMSQEDFLAQFDSLPPKAQRQVLDFIAMLRARYTDHQPSEREIYEGLAEDDFVGMWRDREDMQQCRMR